MYTRILTHLCCHNVLFDESQFVFCCWRHFAMIGNACCLHCACVFRGPAMVCHACAIFVAMIVNSLCMCNENLAKQTWFKRMATQTHEAGLAQCMAQASICITRAWQWHVAGMATACQ